MAAPSLTPVASAVPVLSPIGAPGVTSSLTLATSRPVVAQPVLVDGLVIPAELPVVLTPDEKVMITGAVNGRTAQTGSMLDISDIGAPEFDQLDGALKEFTARITRDGRTPVFNLVDAVSEAVERAKLGDLADRILSAKPSWTESARAGWAKMTRRGVKSSAALALARIRSEFSTATGSIDAVLVKKEETIAKDAQTLRDEVGFQTNQIEMYRDQFRSFLLTTVMMHTLSHRWQEELRVLEASSNPDPVALEDVRAKVEHSISRALTLESTLTRIPNEQMLIRQMQMASIKQYHETVQGTKARFASIRGTLIRLNSALALQEAQRSDEAAANLDANLRAVAARVSADVISKSATAAGRNARAQAAGVSELVAEVQNNVALAKAGAAQNAADFAEATKSLAQSRKTMTELGAVVRPDRPISLDR